MTCEEYLEDPEANASHLASCEICRALDAPIDEEIEVRHLPMSVDALPLAPWEGAKHRTWPLVGAAVLAMLTLAIVLSAAAEVSPIAAAASSLASVRALLTFFQLTGQAMGAPLVALLFVVTNVVLFLLLRRAPKGVDV